MSLSTVKALISGALLVLASSDAGSHLFAQSSQASLSGIIADGLSHYKEVNATARHIRSPWGDWESTIPVF